MANSSTRRRVPCRRPLHPARSPFIGYFASFALRAHTQFPERSMTPCPILSEDWSWRRRDVRYLLILSPSPGQTWNRALIDLTQVASNRSFYRLISINAVWRLLGEMKLAPMEEAVVNQQGTYAGSASMVGADLLARCRDWWQRRNEFSPCAYCGSTAFGPGCSGGPRGVHQHQTDNQHCEYCGSTAYGWSCSHSPTHAHRHGGGGGRCRWCGSSSSGIDCSYYPTGVHER